MKNVYGLLISLLYIGLVIGISRLFTRAGKEASRKFIHIMLANWWIIAMVFFDNVYVACVLPAVFVIVNYLSYKYDIIKEMERDDEPKSKQTLGTVYYAITLLITAIFTFGIWHKPIVGLVGVCVMGYGDGFAAVAGCGIKSKEFKIFGSTKSIAGSLTMLIISLIIISGALVYFQVSYWIIKSIVLAVIATVLEAISPKGTDNLTVPLAVTLLTYLIVK